MSEIHHTTVVCNAEFAPSHSLHAGARDNTILLDSMGFSVK